MVEYVAHESELDTTNIYGSIKEAVLKLRAGIIEIRLRGPNNRGDDGGFIGQWKYDMLLPGGDEESVGVVCLDRVDDYRYMPKWDRLFAMQVKVQQAYVGPGRELRYSGLVLQSVDEAHAFKRVGVFLLDERHLGLFSSVKKNIVTLI